jgi:hypothetical protein
MQALKTLLVICALAATALAANVTGKWKMTANAPDGNTHNVELVVKEEAGKLTGSLETERGSMPLQEVVLNNDELTFKLVLDMGAIPFKLKVDGDTMKGTLTSPDGATGTVTAKRDGAAAPAGTPAAAVSATGKWKVVSKDPEGNEMKVTLDLQQDGDKITGQIMMENGDVAPVSDGKITGNEFKFKIQADGEFEVTGTISGNEVKGTYKTPNGSKGSFAGSK